jgi:hypothetical protein
MSSSNSSPSPSSSSSSSSSSSDDAPLSTIGEVRQDARNARMSIKKMGQEKLRKELFSIAQSKCDEKTKVFSECAQREGFMVVIKCRTECNQSEHVFSFFFDFLLFFFSTSERLSESVYQRRSFCEVFN